MAIAPVQSTAIIVFASCALAATIATAAAQDPAYVDATRAASAADPARIGGSAAGTVPQPRVGPASVAVARRETLQRLQRAEALQAHLAVQFDDGSALSREQRTAMRQWFEQSDGLLADAWRRLGGIRSGSGTPAARIAGGTAAPAMFDSPDSLRRDPRIREGAQQAKAAMDAMQRTLLPMLQELRDDIDAELQDAANRSR